MTRRSAADRREEIVGIAFRHFGVGGFHGTSTEAIAREAGISQPYLFRLFKTKRDLFLACHDRQHERLCAVIGDRLSSQFGADSVTVKASKPEPPIPLPVEEVSVELWRDVSED